MIIPFGSDFSVFKYFSLKKKAKLLTFGSSENSLAFFMLLHQTFLFYRGFVMAYLFLFLGMTDAGAISAVLGIGEQSNQPAALSWRELLISLRVQGLIPNTACLGSAEESMSDSC